ncbi:GNAT family N-acetyltransferase [Amycolatopsis sp. FDAARGOS 1241]|uniref:GNAT family N-acetyltransferase n=1 Tax=Amycolatopsis sp. FDAARGOS 1241 TaxID=2778070 RepID=UPI00194DD709|nr:GNAT family N-acetyltransferase [Amycolatopsis sp. FDAARGOS 1241]QRP43208.1 GNAT family N-acetyltransferase [Amycolatopsis sp. FDAARGOS 1241]
MTILVRKAGSTDRATVLALLDGARGLGLSPAERAAQGFVQGSFDEEKLARFENTTGVYLAEDDGEPAGVALTSPADDADGGPPRLTIETARAAGLTEGVFLYGPVVVAPAHRGQGVVRQLLAGVAEHLAEHEAGVLFVERANAKSLAVHTHLGMTYVGDFSVTGRDYAVFSFAPASFRA